MATTCTKSLLSQLIVYIIFAATDQHPAGSGPREKKGPPCIALFSEAAKKTLRCWGPLGQDLAQVHYVRLSVTRFLAI